MGLEIDWIPFGMVIVSDFCNTPVAASRRIHLTNVVPSRWRSNVAEMWNCRPSLYGAIEVSTATSDVFLVPARSFVMSVPYDHVRQK